MNSMIISAIGLFCKKTADKFKESKLGTALENTNAKISGLWHSSALMHLLKKESITSKGSILSSIVFLPFTFLEYLQEKTGTVLKNAIRKSAICEAARGYVENFMALNTRFWGVMLLASSVIYNILKFSGEGYINKYIAVLTLVSVIMLCLNQNVMGYLGGSKLIDFIKACAGFKKIKFSFYDEEYTTGAFRLVGALLVGILTGAVMFMSPFAGIIIPFGIFGILLVLKYPVCGVYAAVFLAPLVSFSSMPLAGICIFTMFSLALKSVYTIGFKWRREGVGVTLIMFLCVLLVSCVFSFARMNSLVVWIMYFVFISFYFVIINTVDTREKLYGLLRLFVISGALVALYGVMQYVFGWTTTNAWIDEEMFEDDTMRVFSTLANPNVLGEYLLLVLPVSIVFFLKDKVRSLSKWVYMGISLIMLLCLVLTQSRGCWLGFMVSAVVFITFYEGRWWALVPLALCALPFVLPETVVDRLLSIGDMSDSSTSYRVFIWLGAMGILRNYLIGGIGMGEAAFSEVYPLFSYNAIIAPHAHNTYLQLLVEAGLPALVVFIAMLVVYFKNTHIVYKKRHKKSRVSTIILGINAGILGFLVQSMFDYTFYNYRVMAVFFMVLAMGTVFRYTAAPCDRLKRGGESK